MCQSKSCYFQGPDEPNPTPTDMLSMPFLTVVESQVVQNLFVFFPWTEFLKGTRVPPRINKCPTILRTISIGNFIFQPFIFGGCIFINFPECTFSVHHLGHEGTWKKSKHIFFEWNHVRCARRTWKNSKSCFRIWREAKVDLSPSKCWKKLGRRCVYI